MKNDLLADGRRLRLEQVLAIKRVDQGLLDAAEQVARGHHWNDARLKWAFSNLFHPGTRTSTAGPPASIPKV